MKTSTYKSKKGWYWSVGDRFWKNQIEELGRTGIGIEANLLKNNDLLKVELGESKYTLDCVKAVAFIREHNAFETLRGTKIGYVPKSFFELVQVKTKPTPKEVETVQPTLL